MRTIALISIAAFALLSASASAATLVPVVPFPGSTSTGAYGINNQNVIAGSWFDSGGVEHGFFGTLAGNYTSFDYTGNTAKGTQARGINVRNQIVGYGPTDGTGSYVFGPEFEYNTATSAMTTITEAGAPLDGIAQGLNKTGRFSGDHWIFQNNAYTRYGYLGKNGVWNKDLSVFNSSSVSARGTNEAGVVTGFFVDASGFDHGFIMQNGTLTQVDFPDASEQQTFLESINDKGIVAGEWLDNSGSGLFKSFYLDTNTNTFTSIDIPGSTYQQAFGINNAGLITLTSDAGNFIYCPKKPAKCPSGGQEIADGPGITVPAGGFLHAVGHRDAGTTVSRIANRVAVKHVAGGPALP